MKIFSIAMLLLCCNVALSQVKLMNNSGFNGLLLNGKPALWNSESAFWTTDGTPAGTKIYTTKVTTTLEGSGIAALNKGFFRGFTPAYGAELWSTDGTDAGTVLLKDIFPGANGSGVTSFFQWNNKAFFFADDGIHGRELWITDGTAGGTRLLKDLRPGAASSEVSDFAMPYIGAANQVYFITNDNQQGWELWKTDGTEAGTQMVKDFPLDNDVVFQERYVSFKKIGDDIYFTADDGVHGAELWRSNGTPGGTVMVKDIVPGGGGSFRDIGAVQFGNKLLFAVQQENGIMELWTSDGTSAGTVSIKTFGEGTAPFLFHGIAFPEGFLFLNYQGVSASLWRTDGTPAGTIPIRTFDPFTILTLHPGFTNEFQVIHQPPFNGKVFFTSHQIVTNIHQLWITNGTEAGTTVVAPTKTTSLLYGNSHFYFFGNHPTNADSTSLYKTDGTPTGTAVMHSYLKTHDTADYRPVIHFEYNGQLYYSADEKLDNLNKTELFRTGAAPQALPVYTFIGNGNWENPANWQNGLVPPANITGGEIIIDHATGGECLRTGAQTLPPGVKLTIRNGKRLRVVN